MILATKSGWLIAGRVTRETERVFVFKPTDSKHTQKISKSSETEMLFEDVAEAMKWIEEGTKK